MSRRFRSLFVVILGGTAIAGWGNSPVRGEELAKLSPTETMKLVFVRLHEGVPWGLYGRANLGAADSVRRVLLNEELIECHAAAWRILGYIGDGADVNRIRSLLTNRWTDVLTEVQADTVRASLDALGIMLSRKVDGAEALAREVLSPEFWERVRMRPRPPGEQSPIASAYEMFAWAIDGYALSGSDAFQKQIDQAVRSIKDAYTREYMGWRAGANRLAARRASLEAPEADAAARQLMEKGIFNGDMTNPGPATAAAVSVVGVTPGRARPRDARDVWVLGPVAPGRAKEAQGIVAEARTALQVIQGNIVKGSFAELRDQLMDNGAIIARDRWLRSSAELNDDLEREKRLLQLPAVTTAEAVDIVIERTERIVMPKMFGDTEPVAAQGGTVVSVRFRLEGTQEIGMAHFPNQLGGLTVAPDGSFIVVMKKIEDRWLWNPFGW